MGPYRKIRSKRIFDDGWVILDSDREPIAYLDTETMANALLWALTSEVPGDFPPDYPVGDPVGQEEVGRDD